MTRNQVDGQSARVQQGEQDVLEVYGVVDFDSVLTLRQAGEGFISTSEGHPKFDLSGLDGSGSVAVSLLLSWLRYATKLDKTIRLAALPEKLKKIIAVSGLNSVFDPLLEETTS